MKPLQTVLLLSCLTIQSLFAQNTQPTLAEKLAATPFHPDKVTNQDLGPAGFQPCNNPTTITCGVPILNQDNYGVNMAIWVSNFNDLSYNNCLGGFSGLYEAPDRLFKFTLDFSTTIYVNMNNVTGSDLDMFLLNVCNPANCLAASINAGNSGEYIEYYLDPGTYYIVVDGFAGSQGIFDLSLEYNGGCTRPCETAPVIQCGQTLTFQNNFSASGYTSNFNSPDYSNCNIFYNYSAPDRIYQFELNAITEVNIKLEILNPDVDLDLFLMSYCSPPICYEKGINDTQFSYETIVANLNPGVYFIIVDGYGSINAQSQFNLTLDCGGNGDCSNPTTLNCGPIVTNQTTAGGVNNFNANAYSSCSIPSNAPYSAPDKLYKFTLNAPQEVNIAMESLSGANLDMFLLSSCNPPHCINYSNNTGPFESIQASLAAGTYYVLVDGYGGATGSYNIQLSCGCSCIEDTDVGVLKSCEGFEGFSNNAAVSSNSVRWNKWNSSASDAFVRNASSNNYLEMKSSGTPTPDVWFNLGPNANGRHRLSFKMLVESGKNGVYYVLHQAPNSSGGNGNLAYQVNFNSDGRGFVRLAGTNTNVATFNYPVGDWVNVVQIIDISQDVAELWVGGTFVHSWKFSLGANGSQAALEAIDFDADDATFSYRVDNICFRSQDNCTTPPGGTPVCIENGKQYNNQISARCKLYTSDEEQPCNNVCQLGGRFIYRGDTYSGVMDASDHAPWSVKNTPCVQQAYNNNVPPSLYADVYIFSRDDNKDIGISYNNNGNPNIRAFVFVCNSDINGNGNCVNAEDCWEILPPNNFTDIAINTCHSFYYIVITGTLGETYSNLNIVPNGNCPSNPTVITCGQTVSGTVGSQGAPPVPFNSASAPYLQCYNGTRPYTGEESFYKIVLNQPSVITATLTASAPNPSGMGLFLFSFLCGGNCMGYTENTAFSPTATLTADLNEGTYYLVVDKATNAGNSNFTLTLNCAPRPYIISVDDFLTGDFNCPTDGVAAPHQVKLAYSPEYTASDYFEFYYRDINGQLQNNLESNKYWHNAVQPMTFNLKRDDLQADAVKCSYIQGDTFYVFVHQTEDNTGTFKQYKPTFAVAGLGGITDSLKFRSGGVSAITKLTEIGSINFVPEFATITALPAANTRYMDFSSGLPWKVELVNGPAPWLTIDPTEKATATKIALTFAANNSPVPRSVVLRFYTSANPGLYQQFVLVTQQGQCTIPQPVNITTANTSVCAGTPVTLTADVGATYTDVYTYLWSNGSTNTSITVNPSVPSSTYSVTVTNKYCFVTSDDIQTITVTQAPSAPAPINASTCEGQSTPQSVGVVPQSGVQVYWYSSLNSTTPLSPNPGNTYTPIPQPSTTTTYYAEAVQNGCKSQSRTAVTLTVNPRPVFIATDTICSASLQTYSIVVTLSNGNTVSTSPTYPVAFNPANGAYTISNIPKGTSVTITATNTANSCTNTTLIASPICQCTAVNSPTTNNPQQYCPGETAPALIANVGGGTVAEWYNTQNGGNPISTGSTFSPGTPGDYWVQARNTASQCVSPRVKVQLILKSRPSFLILEKTCAPNLSSYTLRFQTDVNSVTAGAYQVNNLNNGVFEITGIPSGQSPFIHMLNPGTGCARDTLVPPAACNCPGNLQKPTANAPVVAACQGSTNVPPLSVSVPTGMSANWYRNGQLQFGSPNTQINVVTAGDYWAKTLDPQTQCESKDSTKVTLQYTPLPSLNLIDRSCDLSWQTYQVLVSSSTSLLSSNPSIAPIDLGNNQYKFEGVPISSTITITATANSCPQTIDVNPPVCSCTINPQAPQNPNNPSMCLGSTIPLLSVTISNPSLETVDWYDAPVGGNLLTNPSVIKSQYQPVNVLASTDYYAQARFIQNGCVSPRTKVTLKVDQPAISFAGSDAIICLGQSITLSGSLQGSAVNGTWTATPLGGSFSPNNTYGQASSYAPPAGFQGGNITLSLTGFPAQPSVCPAATDKMILTVNPVPALTISDPVCEPNLNFYSIPFTTDADDVMFSPNVGNLVVNPDNTYSYAHIPEGVGIDITVVYVSTGCTRTIHVDGKNCDCTSVIPKPTSLGDKSVCEGVTQYPTLEVSTTPGLTIDWYDAETNGQLLRSSDPTFENPPGPGDYWAEARQTGTSCKSERTLVKLLVAPNPIADAGADKQVCPGLGNVTITAVPHGTVDSYSWNNGQIGPEIQAPVQNAIYILTAKLGDCTDMDTVVISVLPGVSSVQFNQINVRCNGGNDGELTAQAVGGAPPYQFLWSNGSTQAQISALLPGTYTVTVTSAQTCSAIATATITQPAPIQILNTVVQNTTNNLNNGSIMVDMTGGVAPYSYQWLYLNNQPIGGETSNLLDTIYADKYKVRVTDANGCFFVSGPITVDNTTIGTTEPGLNSRILLFPNPTNGKVYLRSSLAETQETVLEVIDAWGQQLMQMPFRLVPESLSEIDLSDKPAGIYLLKIRLKDGTLLTKKVSVKR